MRALCATFPKSVLRAGTRFFFFAWPATRNVGFVNYVCLAIICGGYPLAILAEEPNDTFAQSTVLEAGTLSVSDDLFAGTGSAPDTFLGVFDQGGFDPFENWIAEDNNSSTLGNGTASGLTNIGVNTDGSVRFIVTGNGDFFFDGGHEENGDYKAVVEVFDAGGSPVDTFSVDGTLQAGVADQYTFSDSSWLDGDYTINIDNTVSGFAGGDVDFFTFPDLTPGAAFSAETSSIGEIDTVLGWYNDTGAIIAQDDDSGDGVWSLLAGIVPASGQLTFAVTGSGDGSFAGEHGQQDFYDLQLTIDGAGSAADFDGDGDVDGGDLIHPTLGWEVRYGADLGGGDFLVWQQEFGTGLTLVAATAVPEPTTVGLANLSLLMGLLAFSHRRTSLGL